MVPRPASCWIFNNRLYFEVRVQCRRERSSRLLSYLLMSFLFSASVPVIMRHSVLLTDKLSVETAIILLLPCLPVGNTLHVRLEAWHHTPHHNRFTALFPGPLGWAGARRELLDFMVQVEINRGRHTDHPAGCHSIRTNQCPPLPSPHSFYRPDALPAALPTAS